MGHVESVGLVDLEDSAVTSTSSLRTDLLHDLTVVIVRDNKAIERPAATHGELGNRSKVFFSGHDLEIFTNRANNGSLEPALTRLSFNLLRITKK
jgi:hypothetical protein